MGSSKPIHYPWITEGLIRNKRARNVTLKQPFVSAVQEMFVYEGLDTSQENCFITQQKHEWELPFQTVGISSGDEQGMSKSFTLIVRLILNYK